MLFVAYTDCCIQRSVLILSYNDLFSSEEFVKKILTLKTDEEVRQEFVQKRLNLSDEDFNELKSALDLVVRRKGQIIDDVIDQICGPKWTENEISSLSVRAIIRAAGQIVNELPFDFYEKFGQVWFYNPDNDIRLQKYPLA